MGTVGISANNAGSVQIIDSAVIGMTQIGILIQSRTASVTGSLVVNNGRFDIVANAVGSTRLNLNGDVIVGASVGISSNQSGSPVFVTDCNVSGSSNAGIQLINGAIGFVKHSVITSAGSAGLLVSAENAAPFVSPPTVYLDTTTITGNATGVINSGGTVNSYGNNNIAGNTTNSSGNAITRVSPN